MKITGRMLNMTMLAVLLAATGCCCLRESDAKRLLGKWKGDEIGAQSQGPCFLTVEGRWLYFVGTDTNEWYKGNFTVDQHTDPRRCDVVITDCPMAKYIGKTSHAIYRFENKALMITANEPGDPNTPPTFDAPGARYFVFRKQ